MDNKLLGGKAGNEGIPMDLTQQMLLASQLGIPPAMLDPSLSSGIVWHVHVLCLFCSLGVTVLLSVCEIHV